MNEREKELAAKAVCGDKKALSQLLKIYFEDILYFAVSQTNWQEGEEIAQQVILNVYRDIKKLKEPFKFKSWLMTLVYHDCIDHIKKVKRVKARITESEMELSSLEEDNSDFLPDEYILNKEYREQVMQTIRELPENYANTLLLYFYQELTYSEIAEVLGVNKDKVRNDLYRGKIKLKEILERKTGEEFMLSVVPVGTLPMLSQLFQADKAATVTSDISAQIWANIYNKNILVNYILHQFFFSGKAGIAAKMFLGSVSGLLTVAVMIGFVNPRSEPAEVVVELQQTEETSAPSASMTTDTESAAFVIVTLEDMIGEEETQELLAFEAGPVDEEEWRAFLDRIGANQERIAEEYDDTYVMYLVQKQDKQLLIAERANKNSGEIDIFHQFGDISELPLMIEIILQFSDTP